MIYELDVLIYGYKLNYIFKFVFCGVVKSVLFLYFIVVNVKDDSVMFDLYKYWYVEKVMVGCLKRSLY